MTALARQAKFGASLTSSPHSTGTTDRTNEAGFDRRRTPSRWRRWSLEWFDRSTGRAPPPPRCYTPLLPSGSTLTRARGSKPHHPQLIGEILPRFLERTGISAKVEAASVVPEWEQFVGPGIAAVTQPLRVTEGTLIVAVKTSAWMMELNMMKAELMRRLNVGKRQGRIEQIVFIMAA